MNTTRWFRFLPMLSLSLLISACALPTAAPTPAQTPKGHRVLNIAHRGARSLAPENTLAAAQKGWEAGADMWELDVRMTADGELIIMHDATLERTCNVRERFPDRRPWLVTEFTLAEIKTLDCGSWFNEQDPFGQIRAGAVSAEDQAAYVGEQVPTLQEALQFTRDHDWRVMVEIKDIGGEPGDETIVEAVIALIEEQEMTDRVIVSSFKTEYLRRARAANPDIPLLFLTSRGALDPVAYMQSLNAQVYGPKVTKVRPKEVEALRAAGFDVHVWTVNDEETMRELIAMGVTGIITDFPQVLADLLREGT